MKIDDTPPAALLACPEPPEGFPSDAVAMMPPVVRFAVTRLASAYAATVSQLERLIAWHAPDTCNPKAR